MRSRRRNDPQAFCDLRGTGGSPVWSSGRARLDSTERAEVRPSRLCAVSYGNRGSHGGSPSLLSFALCLLPSSSVGQTFLLVFPGLFFFLPNPPPTRSPPP